MEPPPFGLLRQVQNQPELTDIASAVRQAWESSALASRLKPGQTVAIGCGSRGIVSIDTMARETIAFFKSKGCKPFIVSAMGSHGGANSKGQRELLGEYGISEEKLGVPVKTDMTSTVIGQTTFNEPVHWDANALAADVVVTLSRIKPHTDFRGRYESGIVKMLVIGLGKREGASQHHQWGYLGLRDRMPQAVRVIMEKTNFQAGLAILENAREKTASVEVVDKADLLDREPLLLDEARSLMGRLPFHQLDMLVIGEIGKNYSGAGIDPNVVGRLLVETMVEDPNPSITRICALDLSPESHGNGTGVGIADLTTQRLLDSIDPVPFRMNNLTACFLWRSKLPLAFPNDRDCIQAGLDTCWQPIFNNLRMAIIPNSLELEWIWASPTLLEEAASRKDLRVEKPASPLAFDPQGNWDIPALFPHSVPGRRNTGKGH